MYNRNLENIFIPILWKKTKNWKKDRNQVLQSSKLFSELILNIVSTHYIRKPILTTFFILTSEWSGLLHRQGCEVEVRRVAWPIWVCRGRPVTAGLSGLRRWSIDRWRRWWSHCYGCVLKCACRKPVVLFRILVFFAWVEFVGGVFRWGSIFYKTVCKIFADFGLRVLWFADAFFVQAMGIFSSFPGTDNWFLIVIAELTNFHGSDTHWSEAAGEAVFAMTVVADHLNENETICL